MNETEAGRERHRKNQLLREHNERREAHRLAREKELATFAENQRKYLEQEALERQEALANGAFVVYHAEATAVGEPYEPDRPVWDGFYSTREKAVKAMNEWFDKLGMPTILDDQVWTSRSFDTTYEGRVLEELVR